MHIEPDESTYAHDERVCCTPLVSVIIPTMNSVGTIGSCLKSINEQSHSNIEIIAVDNLSTDSTEEICRAFGAKFLQHAGERTTAKNLGIAEAKGEFLILIDSDM